MIVALEVINYKNAYIVPMGDGVDIVDQTTGHWYRAKSVQAAKWNLSVWHRLRREFKADTHKKAS